MKTEPCASVFLITSEPLVGQVEVETDVGTVCFAINRASAAELIVALTGFLATEPNAEYEHSIDRPPTPGGPPWWHEEKFPGRAEIALQNLADEVGIVTARQLAAYGVQALMRRPNVGKTTIDQYGYALEKRGLYLKGWRK